MGRGGRTRAPFNERREAGKEEEARKVFDLTSAGIGLSRELSEERGVDCEFENVENLMGAVTENQEARLEAEQKTFAALGLNSTWLSEAELRALLGQRRGEEDVERGGSSSGSLESRRPRRRRPSPVSPRLMYVTHASLVCCIGNAPP